MSTFTLLNTRPEPQAHGLSELVKVSGGMSINCPTLAIVYRDLPKGHAPLCSFDKVVFISVNAVNGFVKQGFSWSQTEQACPTYFVIGRATLKAAEKAGLLINEVAGDQFDSEHLLQHPDLQDLSRQSVLIVKGENGRELLAETFEQRGATVETWSLYSRQPQPFCSEAWLRFRQMPNRWVLASSVASLQSLMEALEVSKNALLSRESTKKMNFESEQACSDSQVLASQLEFNELLQQPLVVFSQRIKDWANQQGWQGPISVVNTQSDEGVLDCIMKSLPGKEGKQHD